MTAPAGWYPQPDGQQRYWDGQQWTENFAPGTPLASAPAVARKNWFLRHKILTAIGGLLLIGVFSSLANGGTKSDTIAPVGDQIAKSEASQLANRGRSLSRIVAVSGLAKKRV